MLYREEKKHQAAHKRSVRFMARLAGNETTRMFIGNKAIRIEGQHLIYELCRTGGRMGHGSVRLSLFDKEFPDKHLANVCIYTPNVPMGDHACSLIMHVKTGLEHEILEAGNLYGYDYKSIPDGHYVKAFMRDPDTLPDIAKTFAFLNEHDHPRLRNRDPVVMENLRKALYRDLYEDVLCNFVNVFQLPEIRALREMVAGPYQRQLCA